MSWATQGGCRGQHDWKKTDIPHDTPPVVVGNTDHVVDNPTMSWTTRCLVDVAHDVSHDVLHDTISGLGVLHDTHFISRHSHDMVTVPHDMGVGASTTW